MTDMHRLVERVREMSDQRPEKGELELADRPPSSEAQRRRLDNAPQDGGESPPDDQSA